MLLKKLVRVDETPIVFRYNPESKEGVLACEGIFDNIALKILDALGAKYQEPEFYGKRVRYNFKAEYKTLREGLSKLDEEESVHVEDLQELGRMLWDEPK